MTTTGTTKLYGPTQADAISPPSLLSIGPDSVPAAKPAYDPATGPAAVTADTFAADRRC
jgi:hypothetical protein